MAVADGVVPSPPPPPPLASRNIAASLARRHLGRAAADAITGAVVFVFLASMWLVGAGDALSVIGRRACGEGSAVVAVASRVSVVAVFTIALPGPFLFVLVVSRLACSGSVSSTVAEEDDQAQAPKSIARVARELLRDPITLAAIASVAFLFLMCVGELLKDSKSVKGSHRERIASLISDMGSLGAEALFCLLIFPVSVVRTWKSWNSP